MADLTGQIVLERYVVLKRLGEGGMGEVYLAVSRGAAGVSRPVVIKRMLAALNSVTDARVMFEREARILSLMNHPGIVRVTEFGVGPDESYLMVMDYVEGADLLELMARQPGLMPVSLALHIVLETLDAMEYAHTLTDQSGAPLGVVHRDISASNILIDRRGRVVLLDFGVAKSRLDPVKTATNQYKGKFAYMAPELIALTAEASANTDVYSLAVVFHEVLLGRNVMYAEDLRTAFAKVMNHTPERVDAIRSNVPKALADVVARALEKDPTKRFATARAFRDALLPFRTEAVETLREQLGSFARSYFAPPAELAQYYAVENKQAASVPAQSKAQAPNTIRQAPQAPAPTRPGHNQGPDRALAATMVGPNAAGTNPAAPGPNAAGAKSPEPAAQRPLQVGELKIEQQGPAKPHALAAVMRPGAGGLLGFEFDEGGSGQKIELGDRTLPTPAKLVAQPRIVPKVASNAKEHGYSQDARRRRAIWFGIGGVLLLGIAIGSYTFYRAQVREYAERMARERLQAEEARRIASGGGQGGSTGPTSNTATPATATVGLAGKDDAGIADAELDGGDATTSASDQRVWVVAAHPGDESIQAANAMANYAKGNVPVTVIVLTNGDANCDTRGDFRQAETVEAMQNLGLTENNIEFLGYPDKHLADLGTEPTSLFPRLDVGGHCTPANTTQASRGNGSRSVRARRARADGPYLRAELEADLAWLLARDRPTDIYLPSLEDGVVDHVIATLYVRRVLAEENREATLHYAARENGSCTGTPTPQSQDAPAPAEANGRAALSSYRSQPQLQAYIHVNERFDTMPSAGEGGTNGPNLFSCAVGLAPCYSDCRLMLPTRTPISIIISGCPSECRSVNFSNRQTRDYVCGGSLEWSQMVRPSGAAQRR